MCLDIDSQCSKLVVGSADNKLVQVAIQMSTVSSLFLAFWYICSVIRAVCLNFYFIPCSSKYSL